MCPAGSDPLHGNGHRGFPTIFMGRVEHHPCWKPGYHCARAFILAELAASVEWQLHCALSGPPRPMGAAVFCCCCWRWCMGRCSASCAICSTAVPSPPGTYRSAAAPPLTAVMFGADCLCGEQSGLSARQRDQHEHFFHPHTGGFFRRADLICAARAAAGERFAQRACRHGRGASPSVRAVQAQQGGRQAHQPALP